MTTEAQKPLLALYSGTADRGKTVHSELIELDQGQEVVVIGTAENFAGTGSLTLELLFHGGLPLPLAQITGSTQYIRRWVPPGVYRLSCFGGAIKGSIEVWGVV